MIEMFVDYTVARGIIQSENTEVKKKILKCAGTALGGSGAFAAIVYCFGVMGIIEVPIGMLLASSGK